MLTGYFLVTYEYNFRALKTRDRGFESSLMYTLYVQVLICCVPLCWYRACINARPSMEPY
jgi:hypothetical protein